VGWSFLGGGERKELKRSGDRAPRGKERGGGIIGNNVGSVCRLQEFMLPNTPAGREKERCQGVLYEREDRRLYVLKELSGQRGARGVEAFREEGELVSKNFNSKVP